MRPIRFVVLATLLAAAPVALGGASDAIKVFKSEFKPGMMESTRAAALGDLATKADEAVLEVFEWARSLTAREVVRLVIQRDDVLKALEPVEQAMAAAAKAAADAAKKAGRPPPPTFPVDPAVKMKFDQLRQRADRLQGKIDTEYDLRALAAEALGEWIDGLPDAIRGKVLKTFERRTLKSPDWAVRKFHAKGLGHTKSLGATRLLLMRLEAERDRRVLPVIIDSLSMQGGDVAVEHLLPFLADERWQIRAATIAGLGRIGSTSAIDALIRRLREEDGRLRGDIAAALKKITGQDLGINPDRWQTWWEANRKSFGGGGKTPEGEAEAEKPDAPPPPNTPSFYGIRVLSKRILFVIDISGSMTESAGKDRTKIDVAKYELKNAILGLAEDAQFNIVPYAESVAIWRKGMVKAKGKDRRAAVKFIEKMEAVGATNIFGALQRAFHLVGLGAHDKNYDIGADTIFFLSDGQPTRGEILDPDKILACVKRWNSLRRVKIHAVGVGPGHDAAFMRDLAESSGGKYVKR